MKRSTWGRRLGAAATAAVSLLALVAITAPAAPDFPQTAPNDPGYQPAETDPVGHCIDQEQWEFYSFLPKCAPAATDPEGASGMSIDRAWRDFTTGRPDTVIAYVEGGINWHPTRRRRTSSTRST